MLSHLSVSHLCSCQVQIKVFIFYFPSALGYPWLPHVPLPSISHHQSWLLHSLSTEWPRHQAPARGEAMQRVKGRQAPVTNFLPELIHMNVREMLHHYSRSIKHCLQACASASSPLSSFVLIHSSCISEMHTQTHVDYGSTETSLEIKHLKAIFPIFLHFKSFLSFLPSLAHHPLHLIFKATPSLVD